MDVEGASPADGELSPEESLGARIRDFRLARRMSLRALASQAQTSPGFLSQLERGQVNASIGTLRKLAEGLGMTLPDLFTDVDANQPKILRRAERPVIHASNLTSKYLLSQKPLLNLEVYAGELLPGGDGGKTFTHGDAQEIVVVVAGSATLELAGVEYPLDVGDSAEYRTSTPHTIRNRSEHPVEVLWIVSPPTGGVT